MADNIDPDTGEPVAVFITVDYLGRGVRGVFCDRKGRTVRRESDKPFLDSEMWECLGAFALIMKPANTVMSEAEIAKHTRFIPFDEYKCEWGMALTPDQLVQYRRIVVTEAAERAKSMSIPTQGGG